MFLVSLFFAGRNVSSAAGWSTFTYRILKYIWTNFNWSRWQTWKWKFLFNQYVVPLFSDALQEIRVIFSNCRGRDISVGIYLLGGQGCDPRLKECIFFSWFLFRLTAGPNQSSKQWVKCLFPGGKANRAWSSQFTPSSGKVKNEWNFIYISLLWLHGMSQRDLYHLIVMVRLCRKNYISTPCSDRIFCPRERCRNVQIFLRVSCYTSIFNGFPDI